MFKTFGVFIGSLTLLLITVALYDASEARALVGLWHQLLDAAIDQIVYFQQQVLPLWLEWLQRVVKG